MRGTRSDTWRAAALLLALAMPAAGDQRVAPSLEESPQQRSADDKLFIDSRHTEGIAFAAYRTWAWIPMDETLDNPVLHENRALQGWIKDGVERALAAKGYSRTRYGDADFSLAYQVSVRDVSVVRKHRFRGFSHGYRRDRMPRWREVTKIEELPEGTLVLDVVDPDLDAVVWVGRVAGVIAGKVTETGIAEATAKLLDRFPPE